MPVALSDDIKEQARTLYIAGRPPVEICNRLSLKQSTLRQWSIRHKWRKTKEIAANTINQAICAPDTGTLQQLSERIRFRFANVIHRQLATLEDSDLEDITELANTPKRQGLAALAKSIYDMAEGVFGWGDEKQSGMILLTDVRQFEGQPQEAIVVSETNQVADTPQPVDMATETESTSVVSPSPTTTE